MSNSSQNFWEFSVQLYSSPEVSAACLDLQNQHGIDVNLLLLCCWCGARGTELTETSLSQSIAYSRKWAEQVIKPLRQTRVWMKSNIPNDQNQQLGFLEVRKEIKTVELSAEKHQQSVLEEIVLSQPDSGAKISPKEAIEQNVHDLINHINIADSSTLRTTLSLVIRAAAAD
ncbi:MAG: hypothetical protein ACJAY7_000630 [Pseudohongiellaceae bacterium]|jgi:uncharacterized protein (TIGR02444 family)